MKETSRKCGVDRERAPDVMLPSRGVAVLGAGYFTAMMLGAMQIHEVDDAWVKHIRRVAVQ